MLVVGVASVSALQSGTGCLLCISPSAWQPGVVGQQCIALRRRDWWFAVQASALATLCFRLGHPGVDYVSGICLRQGIPAWIAMQGIHPFGIAAWLCLDRYRTSARRLGIGTGRIRGSAPRFGHLAAGQLGGALVGASARRFGIGTDRMHGIGPAAWLLGGSTCLCRCGGGVAWRWLPAPAARCLHSVGYRRLFH